MTRYLIEDDVYRGRLDLALWRRIVAHARPYRRQLIGLGLSGVVIAGIDVGFPLVTGFIIDDHSSLDVKVFLEPEFYGRTGFAE